MDTENGTITHNTGESDHDYATRQTVLKACSRLGGNALRNVGGLAAIEQDRKGGFTFMGLVLNRCGQRAHNRNKGMFAVKLWSTGAFAGMTTDSGKAILPENVLMLAFGRNYTTTYNRAGYDSSAYRGYVKFRKTCSNTYAKIDTLMESVGGHIPTKPGKNDVVPVGSTLPASKLAKPEKKAGIVVNRNDIVAERNNALMLELQKAQTDVSGFLPNVSGTILLPLIPTSARVATPVEVAPFPCEPVIEPETKKDRRNRKARERRAAKKANK